MDYRVNLETGLLRVSVVFHFQPATCHATSLHHHHHCIIQMNKRSPSSYASRRKADILATLQDGSGGNGGGSAITTLRSQASALQQYVELSTEVERQTSKRTVNKQKDIPVELNRQSKLVKYLRSETGGHHRIGGTRVYTIEERMKAAEQQHHERLYNWAKIVVRRRKEELTTTSLEEEEQGQEASSSSSSSVLDISPSDDDHHHYHHHPKDRRRHQHQHNGATTAPESESRGGVHSQTAHRMQMCFDSIDTGRSIRPHKFKMMRKKAMAPHPHPHPAFMNPVPPPKKTMTLDENCLEARIRTYQAAATPHPGAQHRVTCIDSSMGVQPRELRRHHQHSKRKQHVTGMPATTVNVNPTDEVMKGVLMYIRSMPSPHLFGDVDDAWDEDTEGKDDVEDRNGQTTKFSGVKNVAANSTKIASLVSKFHKKIRRRQLINRYSSSKELSQGEFAELQRKAKIFFEESGNQTDRFVSSLVMRWLRKKTDHDEKKQDMKIHSEKITELIDRHDRTALYTLHVYMDDTKMLSRYLRTKIRLDQQEILLERVAARSPLPSLVPKYESAVERLLS